MKKNILYFISAICFEITVFSFITIESNAATDYQESEPNNYVGTADVIDISSGNTVNGSINYEYSSSGDNYDWYKFSLKKGSEINIKTYFYIPEYAGRLFIYFYKSGNTDEYQYDNYVSYNNNLGYAYDNSIIYLSKGTYYIKLLSDADGNYKYKMKFNTEGFETVNEPNDYIGQAFSLSSGKTYYALLNSHNNVDYDFYKYKASNKGYYYLTVKNYNIDSKYSGFKVLALNKDGDEKEIFPSSYGKNSYWYISPKKRETQLVCLSKGTTYFNFGDYHLDGKYTLSITKKPSKVTGVKAVTSGSKSIKVKWNTKSNVTGYKVYRSTKKNSGYKLIKTISNSKTSCYIDKNKKKGRTYYYKIAAYKRVNGYSCRGYYSSVVSKKR